MTPRRGCDEASKTTGCQVTRVPYASLSMGEDVHVVGPLPAIKSIEAIVVRPDGHEGAREGDARPAGQQRRAASPV